MGTVEIMLLLAAGDDVAAGAESLKAGWFWNLGMCGYYQRNETATHSIQTQKQDPRGEREGCSVVKYLRCRWEDWSSDPQIPGKCWWRGQVITVMGSWGRLATAMNSGFHWETLPLRMRGELLRKTSGVSLRPLHAYECT